MFERLAKRFPKSWDRLPPTLALVAVVLLATWMGDASGGYFVGDWALAAFVLATLALVIPVIGASLGTESWGRILALTLLAAYTAWTLASLIWSPNKGDAWLGVGQTLLYLLVFWIAVALLTLGASRRWVLAASALGPSVVAALTLPSLGPRFQGLFDNSRLVGTVGYYNGEAAFLLVPFWAAIYLGGSRRVNPFLRGLVLAGAVLSLDLAVLTQSRGAMVAMIVSLPVFFLFSGQRLRGLLALVPVAAALFVAFPGLNEVYLSSLNQENPATALDLVLPTVWLTAIGAGLYGLSWGLIDVRWSPPVGVVRVVGGAVLVSGLVLLIAGGAILVERTGGPITLAQQKWEAFKTNDTTGEGQSRYLTASGSGRYTLWQVAWYDFVAHPTLGVGTQNYEATYYRLREQNVGPARQPHMLPLEVLGERGIVGGVLFFGFLAACLATGLRKRFGTLRSEGKAQVGALAAAVTYWFVHSSAEWFWQLPAVTLPAFVYLAMLVSPWGRDEIEPAGWPLRASAAGIAVLAVAIVAPLYLADRYLTQSYAAKAPKEALAAAERAQEFNPLNPRIPQQEAELAIEIGDWNRVEAAYDREIQLNPEHYAPYMFRATFHERRGELEEALLYFQKALTRNPLNDDLKRHVNQLQNAS